MRVMEQKRAGWRSPGHSREWISSLRRYAFPRIGEMAVSEVTSADVLEILTPIWHVKAPHGPGTCTSVSARCWNGPWRWSSGPTTHATESGRSSERRTTW